MSTEIKILVCCHKKDIKVDVPPYYPIHVGKCLNDINLGIQGDDVGDNISDKNASYCELTGMYWAWKNLKNTDIIGLCHYRRYFNFQNSLNFLDSKIISVADFNKLDFSIPTKILSKIKGGSIIAAKRIVLPISVYTNYCEWHNSADILKMGEILKNEYPQNYYNAYVDLVLDGNKLKPYNMFMMRWDMFERYCSWLFPLLKKIEKVTDISSYDDTQKRLYGYLAERLFNIYIYANNIETIEKPIIFIGEEKENRVSQIKRLVYSCWNNLVFSLLQTSKGTR